MGQFKFIDLFSGIGGFRIPFEEIGGRCAFSAEWDKFSRRTYEANFSVDHEFAWDIEPYSNDPNRIPPHDLLLAGFPCQPFSIAGVSKKNSLGKAHGFLDDTQGTCFHDIAKVLEYHKSRMFLLENVKNLASHDKGKTFSTILSVLEGLGYTVFHKVIDSSFWVPQKRERIFIVGFHDTVENRDLFSFDKLKIPSDRPTLGSILDDEVDPKYTLTENLWTYLQAYKKKHRKAGNGFGYSLFGNDDVSRTLSARYHKDGSEILIEQDNKRPRRLTPRECSRLMGFPEGWIIPVSDTQAYRQFGNAVCIPVVRALAKIMKPHLNGH